MAWDAVPAPARAHVLELLDDLAEAIEASGSDTREHADDRCKACGTPFDSINLNVDGVGGSLFYLANDLRKAIEALRR